MLLKHDVKQAVELLFEQSRPLLLALPRSETKRPLHRNRNILRPTPYISRKVKCLSDLLTFYLQLINEE